MSSYSSHGAYADFGDVQVYIPLRLMSDPPPTSARKAVKIGDELDVVVAAFAPGRRSIDVALPAMADRIEPPSDAGEPPEPEPASQPKKRRPSRRRGKKAAAETTDAQIDAPSESTSQPEPANERRRILRPSPRATPPPKAPAKKRAARKKPAAKKAPAKKAAAKKPAAKKAAAKKAPAKKKAAAKKAPAKKKAAARKSPAKKKAAAKKAAAPAPADEANGS
ncbi:MAG: hypothetical protein R2697_11400 [Ilumatobacteraceae bacterium]